MRFTSSSMMVAVCSLYSREPVASAVPENGSSRSLKEIVPSRSLMPQRATIWWAMAVTRCRSFSAPVVMCPMATCSAARPPRAVTRLARSAPTIPGVARDGDQVHVFGQRHVARVYFENSQAAIPVRTLDGHSAVEAAWAQKRFVQPIGPVGGRYNDDSLVRIETIH